MKALALASLGFLVLTLPAPAQPIRPVNLHLAGSFSPAWVRAQPLSGSTAVFVVSESGQGGHDLNGDGDAYDGVAFSYDQARRSVVNLGRAVSSAGLFGQFAVLEVDEQYQGATDLNSDGDLLDRVIHVYDTRSQRLTNLGLAGRYECVDGWLAILDLRPGPTVQRSLYLYNLATSARILVSRNIGDFQLGKGLLVYVSGQLDADGDPHFFVYDIPSGRSSDTGLKVSYLQAQDVVVGDRMAAIQSREFPSGHDWNGDGDLQDSILWLYDGESGILKNLGLAAYSDGFTPQMDIDGKLLAWLVPESQQGASDLNGDGDALDNVVFVYDGVSPLNLAVDYSTSYTFNLQVRGTRVAFLGDGYKLFVWQGGFASPLVLGSRVEDFVLSDETLAFVVWEGQVVDLSGDGDPFDRVLFVYDPLSRVVKNVQLEPPALQAVAVSGRRVAFQVDENSHGSTDLNADGYVGQRVLFYLDGKRVQNLGISTQDYGPAIDDDLLLFTASEAGQREDLNGDGDLYDDVLQIARLRGKP